MYVWVLRATTIFGGSAISNHTGRGVAEGPQQWCTVYTKGIHTHICMSQGWVFFVLFFAREPGEGRQTRLTDMNNTILVGMLEDWLVMVSMKIAEQGFFWSQAGSSSKQELWKQPSPFSHKNTLQILWGNKALAEWLSQVVKWARAANQAGSPHGHFLIF